MARVLVLDDEPLIALMLDDWLVELGHQTVGPAHTLAAGLAAVENEPIDAAFLDLNLAGATSIPVAEALTARQIPFAFMTGHGGAVQAAFADAPVLAKPFDFEAVARTVARLTGR